MRRTKLIFSCASFFILLVGTLLREPARAQSLPPEAQKAFDQAVAAERQHNWKQADTELRAAQKIAPESPALLLALAQLNENWPGRELVAMSWYRAYLAAAPNADIGGQIGTRIGPLKQRAAAGSMSLASRAMTAADTLAPKDHLRALSRIARIQAEAGDITTALATIKLAAAWGGDAYFARSAHAEIAGICARRSDFSCVDDLLRTAIGDQERDGISTNVVGALADTKLFSEALRYAGDTSGTTRISAFERIATSEAAANKKAAAKRDLIRAVEAVAHVNPDSYLDIKSLVDLASSLDFLDSVNKTVADFPAGGHAIQANIALALAYETDGNDAAARDCLGRAGNAYFVLARDSKYGPYYTPPGLSDLMHASAVIDDSALGNRLLSMRQSSIAASDLFSQVNVLAMAFRFDEALSRADRIRTPQQRTYALQSIKQARSEYVRTLALAGRFDEAVTVARDIKGKTSVDLLGYPIGPAIDARVAILINRHQLDAAAKLASINPNLYSRTSTIKKIRKLRNDRPLILIKSGDLATAEAALAREPEPGVFAFLWLELRKAYVAHGDDAGARRALEGAVQSAARSSLRVYDYDEYDKLCTELSQLLIDAGDLGTATRLLQAAVGTVAATAAASNSYGRNSALKHLIVAHAKVGRAALANGNIEAAKAALSEAIAATSQISDPGARAEALADAADQLPRVGRAHDLFAAARPLPASFSRDHALAIAAAELASDGAMSEAASAIALIGSNYQRQNALGSGIDRLVAKGDWKNALAFAAGPGDAAFGAAHLAQKMIGAGFFDQAAALELQFSSRADLEEAYIAALATAQASSGQFGLALTTALRQSALTHRATTLLGLVGTVRNLGGLQPAREFFDAAMALAAAPMDVNGRAEFCSAIRSYLAYGATSELAPPGPTLAPACLAEALAKRDTKSRVDALGSALGYPVVVGQPMPGGSLIFGRGMIGRWFAEGEQLPDQSARSSNTARVALALARDGAVDLALHVLAKNKAGSNLVLIEAIKWLVDAGATSSAARVAQKAIDEVEARSKGYARNNGYSELVPIMIALGDFDRAHGFADRVQPQSDRTALYEQIGRAAAMGGHYDAALRAVGMARRIPNAIGTYRSKDLAAIAAVAGDKSLESWINAVAADRTDMTAQNIYDTRAVVVEALLRWKQVERAHPLIEAQEKALAAFDPSRRAYAASLLALDYGWTGNVGGIGRLVLEFPEPGARARLLISAAAGFAKAGKIENARTMLQRALVAINVIRPDAAAWAEYQIAIAMEETDPGAAATHALAIADADWRARAVAWLAQKRTAGNDLDSTAALLRAAPPSAAGDPFIPRVARYLAGKNDLAGVQALIAKALHPSIRDDAQRQAVLAFAAAGNAQVALREVNVIANPLVRAYTLVDIGAALATRGTTATPELAYFAQLSLFSAAKLAATTTDAAEKADILASVAHAQDLFNPAAAASTRASADSAALAITDPLSRTDMRYWATSIVPFARISDQAVSERDDWIREARNLADQPLFADIGGFIEKASSKSAAAAVESYIDGAQNLSSRIAALNAKERKWLDARKAVQSARH